jgi:hypothetical protein
MKAKGAIWTIVRWARKTCGLALILSATAGAVLGGGPLPNLGAPEIDPGSASTALGLLVGGVLMLADRCRRN